MIKRITWLFLGFAASFSIVVMVLLLNAAGRIWLLQSGIGYIAAGTAYEISLDDVSTASVKNWTIPSMRVAQHGEPVLALSNLQLQWQPLKLLQGQVVVDKLDVAEAIFNYKETGKGKTPVSVEDLSFYPLSLKAFSIQNLRITHPSIQETRQYRVEGDAAVFIRGTPMQANLNITTLSGPKLTVSLESKVERGGVISMQGLVEEKSGGLVSSVLRFPEQEPFAAGFTAKMSLVADSYQFQIEDYHFNYGEHDVTGQALFSYDAANELLDIEAFALKVDDVEHYLSGSLRKKELNVSVSLSQLSVDLLKQWHDLPVSGEISAELLLAGELQQPQIIGSGKAKLIYSGVPVNLATKFDFQQGIINFTKLEFVTQEMHLFTDGELNLENEQLALQFRTKDINAGSLRSAGVEIPSILTGGFELQGNVMGKLTAPHITGQLNYSGTLKDEPLMAGFGFSWKEKQLVDTLLDGRAYRGDGYPLDIHKLVLRHRDKQVTGELVLQIFPLASAVAIKQATLETDGSSQHITGTLYRDGLSLSGKLQQFPLTLVSSYLDRDLSGNVSGNISIDGAYSEPVFAGKLFADAHYQGIPFRVEIQGSGTQAMFSFEELKMDSGQAGIEVTGVLDLKTAQTNLRSHVRNLQLQQLGKLGMTLPAGFVGSINADVGVHGNWRQPLLKGNMQFAGHYKNQSVIVDLAGEGTRQQFSISRMHGNIAGDGQFELNGQYAPALLDFSGSAQDIPGTLFQAAGWSVPEGRLKAQWTIKGDPDQPDINASFEYGNEVGKSIDNNLPTSLTATIKTEGENLHANLHLLSQAYSVGQLAIALPWRHYRHVFAEQKFDDIPLAGKVYIDADLWHLCFWLLDAEISHCGGSVFAELAVSGNSLDPLLNGKVKITQGHYENNVTGTVLHDLSLLLAAVGKQVIIEQARATDGDKGKMQLSGGVNWSVPDQPTAIDIKLQVNHAQILRRPDMNGSADGELTLLGDRNELWLSGVLEVSPFKLTLLSLLQDDVPVLHITDTHSRPADLRSTQSMIHQFLPVVNMDMVFKTERRGFLHGPGLQAELAGNITVKGTYAHPDYRGVLKTVRGDVKVLGKTFVLQDGSVQIENDNIYLFIPAVYKHKEIEVRAELSGNLDSVTLTLSSIPLLPEDEIISYLLFGKSAGSITPLQALRLANAVSLLKNGGKPLFDPLSTIQKMTTLDSLSLEESNEGKDVTLGLGKYLSDRVYIEIEAGTNAAQPWTGNVEVELLPNLNLESAIGSDARPGGVELLWKKDY